jgi:hypothetical protein
MYLCGLTKYLFHTQTKLKNRVLNNVTNTRKIEFDFLSNSITDKPCSSLFGAANDFVGMCVGM